MIVLHVTISVRPDHISEFLELARYDAENSIQEPGCLRFEVIQDLDNPNGFYFYEVYQDQSALDSHRQTPHFKAFIEKVGPCLAAPSVRRLGKSLIPADTAWG